MWGGGNHNYDNISLYTDHWWNRTFGLCLEEREKLECIEIGNDVWIGAGVIVMAGVKIGDGCVIGAGTFVNKNIPPYSVAVGTPARIIKKRFDDETISLLEKKQWWSWDENKITENIEILRNKPDKQTLKALAMNSEN